MNWLYQSCVSKIFMGFYNMNFHILWLCNCLYNDGITPWTLQSHICQIFVPRILGIAFNKTLWISPQIMNTSLSNIPMITWITIYITDVKRLWKNSHPTSWGLNPSWSNRKLNNMVDPTDNVAPLLTPCWGPGFSSISPDVKTFILDTQNLSTWLVDFVVLWLVKEGLFACLLFPNSFFVVTMFRFTNLENKQSDLLRYLTYQNL